MTKSKRWRGPPLDNLFKVAADAPAKADVLRRSELFDEAWYLEAYPDVAASGLDPAEHYLRVGALMGRDPGPGFSTGFYLGRHRDVRVAGANPLVHYETSGRIEGRATSPVRSVDLDTDEALLASLVDRRRPLLPAAEASGFVGEVLGRSLDGEPVRLSPAFDAELARRFVSALLSLPRVEEAAAGLKASVVMPTFNRGAKVGQAVRSVLAQSHANLELLVTDDGSTDDTAEVLAGFAHDPRLRVFRADHGGVSAARNESLRHAAGDYVFYLDSDNEWTRDYLKVMLMTVQATGADCAYAASRVQDEDGLLAGYRAEVFDWDGLLERNYVDMNVFCHRLGVTDAEGPFDATLRRVVDWDLILRYTKRRGAVHVPIVGCLYKESGDPSRISVSAPYAIRKIVREKNRHGLSSAEALARLSFNFALKIAAPFDERASWGDFHYAESLAAALERAGHKARIDFRGDWHKVRPNTDDVVVVLRGRVPYEPRPSDVNLLWVISHPDHVTYQECARYDGVFVASESFADLLATIVDTPVEALLQCTDGERFAFSPPDRARPPHAPDGEPARGLFVGNSRGEYRPIVRWAVNAGLDVDVFGGGWEPFLPLGTVKGEVVDNAALGRAYADAAFVLNDHWESMRDFGFVSNRVYDVLGCGGRLVSDVVPSIEAMFGDAVVSVGTEAEFQARMRRGLPPLSERRRWEASKLVHREHSFDARTGAILDWVRGFLLKSPGAAARGRAGGTRGARARVGALVRREGPRPGEAAFARIVAPLLADAAHVDLELVLLAGVEDPRLGGLDACVVQAGAVTTVADVDRLAATLPRGRPLVVDVDEAQGAEARPGRRAALDRLLGLASEACFASPALLASFGPALKAAARVVPDALDPRFWRDYRYGVDTSFPPDRVRFAWIAHAPREADGSTVLPAFERLAERFPGRFDLTLVGPFDAAECNPGRPWLTLVPWPGDLASYPLRVRWLRSKARWDVGLAPAPGDGGEAGSDVAFLDHCALGLLSIVGEGATYRDAVARGLAVGCAGTTEAWFEAAARVVAAPDAFVALRRRANDHVWAERSALSSPLPDLLRSLIAPAADERPRRRPSA